MPNKYETFWSLLYRDLGSRSVTRGHENAHVILVRPLTQEKWIQQSCVSFEKECTIFYSAVKNGVNMRSWIHAKRGLLKQELHEIKEEEKEGSSQNLEEYTTIQKLLQPSVNTTDPRRNSKSSGALLRKRGSSLAAPNPDVVVGEICLMRENPYRIHKVRAYDLSLCKDWNDVSIPVAWIKPHAELLRDEHSVPSRLSYFKSGKFRHQFCG